MALVGVEGGANALSTCKDHPFSRITISEIRGLVFVGAIDRRTRKEILLTAVENLAYLFCILLRQAAHAVCLYRRTFCQRPSACHSRSGAVPVCQVNTVYGYAVYHKVHGIPCCFYRAIGRSSKFDPRVILVIHGNRLVGTAYNGVRCCNASYCHQRYTGIRGNGFCCLVER